MHSLVPRLGCIMHSLVPRLDYTMHSLIPRIPIMYLHSWECDTKAVKEYGNETNDTLEWLTQG